MVEKKENGRIVRVFSFPELPLYLQEATSTDALKIRMNLIIREQNEYIAGLGLGMHCVEK